MGGFRVTEVLVQNAVLFCEIENKLNDMNRLGPVALARKWSKVDSTKLLNLFLRYQPGFKA